MAKKGDMVGTMGLEAAYALETPEDSVKYYGDWADEYDRDFAETMGYVFPREVAERFRGNGGLDLSPILDVGAGTGLLAEEFRGQGLVIDAVDISAEMLAVAGAKGLYRNLITADLTQALPLEDGVYAAMISSGTFTHGHVGPEAFDELLRAARPGALFCLGINPLLWESRGFGAALARLVAAGRVTAPERHDVPIYENADHEHAGDRSEVVVFQKIG